MKAIDLCDGWKVLQDVHDLGEEFEIFRQDPSLSPAGPSISEWEPLPRLGHLQTLLSDQPYFGRELRYFNDHPWWYKLEFETPEEFETLGEKTRGCVIRFDGVDYFAKVWLNGVLLGEHEGYFAPFEFEIGKLLRPKADFLESENEERTNRLVVRAWSPWDSETFEGMTERRTGAVIRNLVKGTYEHGDTFIQRDVNPVGLWGSVKILPHHGLRFSERPVIVSDTEGESGARISVESTVIRSGGLKKALLRCRVIDRETGLEQASEATELALTDGENPATLILALDRPKLWNTWDRGGVNLYRVLLEVSSDGTVLDAMEETFGVRTTEIRRTDTETTFLLNGERLFLRGTSYFPDVYVSKMTEARYRRDLVAIKRSGFNAVRVHVHVERPEFYALCDELGLAVIQDSDLNWTHPQDDAFVTRAVGVFRDMICELRNHPSIVAWVCINEPRGGEKGGLLNKSLGPKLLAEARRLDPRRPCIKGSGVESDMASGDSHNYTGSLRGHDTHYTDIDGSTEKLNTEFGFDAPPGEENLVKVPRIHYRLKGMAQTSSELQTYQYRLLKYYIEHYRIQKFDPCSGYFQFMFIDLCPQSFYGIYDYWGTPKEGLKAHEESGQPLGVFMEHKYTPVAVWAVNDLLQSFPNCQAEWVVTDETGTECSRGEARIDLPANGRVRVAALSFPVDDETVYTVSLILRDATGAILTTNLYRDPFHHPRHPEGHPHRMSHELGMRLYDA